jgi:RNA polymerase sigma-70 factor (ECF subfamily)
MTCQTMSTAGELSARSAPADDVYALTLADVYATQTTFIWKTLHRLGVREPHIEDVFQEVLLVVFKRLPTYNGSSALTTWLFAICFRVASDYRNRAHMRREMAVSDIGTAAVDLGRSPEEELHRREAETRLLGILDGLTLDQRAVFVMFEIDGLRCEEIATMMGVPIGTVHSRLHWARKSFARALKRLHEADARRVA